ncbi:MAG: hypothetical protein ACTHN5_03610 [Phycisphaerae bacterium]
MRDWCVAGLVLLGIVVVGVGQTTGPATQAGVGERGTPEGAMNVFEGALERGDLGVVGDSWNLPAERRKGTARVMEAEYRFRGALEKRFSGEEVERVCKACRIWVKRVGRAYVAGDWQRPANAPDVALPNMQVKDVPVMVMQKGEDGIWRMGRIAKGAAMPEGMKKQMEALEERQAVEQGEQAKRYEAVTAEGAAGKFGSGEEVERALGVEGGGGEGR